MTLAGDHGLGERGQARLPTGYAEVPCSWAFEQADLLRARRLDQIDAHNLADEIEAGADHLADRLRSDLSRILQNLTRRDHQPDTRTRGWALSVSERRKRVARDLRTGPGLKSILPDVLAESYDNARRHALDETGLSRKILPETCPCTWDEIMSRPIEWPDRS